MVISAPYKLHLYQGLAKYLRNYFILHLVSASLGYGGKLPFLPKKLWPIPTREMVRSIIEFRPDVVLTDYPAYPSWYARVYSYLRRERIPIIVWLLGDFWREQSAYFANARFRQKIAYPFALFTWSTGLETADRILPVCHWLERIVNARLPTKKTEVLYQGIDPKPWLVEDDSKYAFERPAVGILQDNNILPKVKGLIDFVEVVKRMTDVHFYIAGGGLYTKLVENAFSNVRNAHFVGRLSYPEEVRKFYHSIELYLLPSGLDCCPITLLEASVSGRPVIASKVGGIPELMKDGETGWCIPNGATEEWAHRIRTVLEDENLAQETGRKARQFVIQHFSWKTQTEKLVALTRELTR
jgi:glycosyltransferase involved in cell wall biosynthesis